VSCWQTVSVECRRSLPSLLQCWLKLYHWSFLSAICTLRTAAQNGDTSVTWWAICINSKDAERSIWPWHRRQWFSAFKFNERF
jgi:hypothetical protein